MKIEKIGDPSIFGAGQQPLRLCTECIPLLHLAIEDDVHLFATTAFFARHVPATTNAREATLSFTENSFTILGEGTTIGFGSGEEDLAARAIAQRIVATANRIWLECQTNTSGSPCIRTPESAPTPSAPPLATSPRAPTNKTPRRPRAETNAEGCDPLQSELRRKFSPEAMERRRQACLQRMQQPTAYTTLPAIPFVAQREPERETAASRNTNTPTAQPTIRGMNNWEYLNGRWKKKEISCLM